MKRIFSALTAVFLVLLPAHAALAQQDGSDDVLLNVEVSGQEVFEFALEDLRALQVVTFETETIWTNGPQQFTGVPLAALVEHVGVSTGALEAHATNDYAVIIPMSDAVDGGPIVAFERNGAQMSLREKGPLWIVYPYDSDPAYKTEAVYSRSIWQLERIVVKQ